MELFREIKEILNIKIRSDETLERNNKMVHNALLILTGVTAVMSVINIYMKSVVMSVTSLMLFGGFTLCLVILDKLKNRNLTVLLFTLIVGIIFTYYFFLGGSEGFSALWLIVFPYAVMSIVDLKYGLYVSTYFLVLLVVFCWTPAKQFLLYDYGEVFFIRFPILYFFSMLIAIRTGYQLQTYMLSKDSTIGDLNTAVEIERKRNIDLSTKTIISISHAVDAKDPYTKEHSVRVAEYAAMIAQELGWSKEQLENIYLVGLIHDIGKIGVPDSVLKKPGKLTDEEFAAIKKHPETGYGIIKDYDGIEGLADGVLYHHERYDGKGYPKHLKGTEIPVLARIIAVADAFDAMNSNRVYRTARDKDYIIDQFERGKGTQFDPEFAEILLKKIRNGEVLFKEHMVS